MCGMLFFGRSATHCSGRQAKLCYSTPEIARRHLGDHGSQGAFQLAIASVAAILHQGKKGRIAGREGGKITGMRRFVRGWDAQTETYGMGKAADRVSRALRLMRESRAGRF